MPSAGVGGAPEGNLRLWARAGLILPRGAPLRSRLASDDGGHGLASGMLQETGHRELKALAFGNRAGVTTARNFRFG